MALIFVFVAMYAVKNTAIDMTAMLTGRTPPSHERQMARMKSGTARKSYNPRRTMAGFFQSAYGDAWEAAHDWKDNAAKRAARRRAVGQTPDPVNPVNPTPDKKPTEIPQPQKVDPGPQTAPKQTEDVPAKTGGDGEVTDPVAPFVFVAMAADVAAKIKSEEQENSKASTDLKNSSFDASEHAYQRYAMRVRNGGKPQSAEQLQYDLAVTRDDADKILESWEYRYKNENAHRNELKISYAKDCAEAMKLHDEGNKDASQVHINRAADTARRMGITSEAELFALYQETQATHQKTAQQKEAQSQNTAGPAPSPTAETQKEVPALTATNTNTAANAETVGLQAGLVFLNGMSNQCTNGASNTEISANSLAAGEVGPGVTGPMAQAMEMLNTAAALFAQAKVELEKSIAVAEAYAAAPNAGNKQFLTTD